MTGRDDIASTWAVLAQAGAITAEAVKAGTERCGSLAQWLTSSEGALRQDGLSKNDLRRLRAAQTEGIQHELLAQPDIHLIHLDHDCYPPLLQANPDAPAVLWVRGDPAVLLQPQVAIVGARACSGYGEDLAAEFAGQLAAGGLTITSGLALGVDGIAHRAALKAQAQTIAVVATGIDRVYPARHRQLAQDIVASGAIVSEFAPGTPPLRYHFPRRNRIIAGMTLGTLVIEASLRSGSRITARQAGEYGRAVMALPGSLRNPKAAGCHELIRNGATLIVHPEHVIEQLRDGAAELGAALSASMSAQTEAATTTETTAEEQAILELVGFDPTTMDQIVERSQLTVDELSSILLELELRGYVRADAGGCYSRQT